MLDEFSALEESKRLELELLESEKKEMKKRMQREHEATKVMRLLSPVVTAWREVGSFHRALALYFYICPHPPVPPCSG